MDTNQDYSEDSKNFFFNEMNKKLKKELNNKFGMQFSDESFNVSPEIIHHFLENVKKFEESWEAGRGNQIKDLYYLPEFRKAEEIQPSELVNEILKVLYLYRAYNINIDVIEKDEVTNLQYYKFLTEELPVHKTDFIPIEGWTTNFIYEEFHPSNKLDAKDIIKWMEPYLFNKKKKEIKTFLTKKDLAFNGEKKTPDEFVEVLLELFDGFGEDTDREILFNNFEFNGQVSGKVETVFLMEKIYSDPESNLSEKTQLKLLFDLERNDYDSFDITGCSVL